MIFPMPLSYTSVFLRTDERGIDEVLSEEPRLEFTRADDVRDDEVVGAVITECGDTSRRVVRVAEDQLVCLEQPGQHRRDLLATVGGPRHLGDLRHVSRVADRDPPKGLHAFGDFIHQR